MNKVILDNRISDCDIQGGGRGGGQSQHHSDVGAGLNIYFVGRKPCALLIKK